MTELKTQDVRCIGCGKRARGHFLDVGAFVLDECTECGMGRTRLEGKKKQSEHEPVYGKEYRMFYTNPQKASLLKKRFTERVKRVLPYLDRVQSALDVGCSYGHFLDVGKNLGWDVVGLEPSKYIFDNLEDHLSQFNIINATLRKASLKAKFDLVTYWDVLEHIKDPDKELAYVRKVLRKGGFIIVQCPNKASLGATLSGSKWGWWTPPDHVYHFTPESLRRLIEGAGFSVQILETYNDEEEIVRGIFNRLSPRNIPRLAAYLDVLHRFVQRGGYPVLYPVRMLEGKLGKAGLIFLLAKLK